MLSPVQLDGDGLRSLHLPLKLIEYCLGSGALMLCTTQELSESECVLMSYQGGMAELNGVAQLRVCLSSTPLSPSAAPYAPLLFRFRVSVPRRCGRVGSFGDVSELVSCSIACRLPAPRVTSVTVEAFPVALTRLARADVIPKTAFVRGVTTATFFLFGAYGFLTVGVSTAFAGSFVAPFDFASAPVGGIVTAVVAFFAA